MAKKNDTLPLLFALIVTAGLLGGGLWGLYNLLGGSGSGLSGLGRSNSVSPPVATTAASSLPPTTTTSVLTPPPQGTTPAQTNGGDFTTVAQVPSGTFKHGGSTSWAPIRGQVDPLVQQALPTYQLTYVNPTTGIPGTGSGIQMLLKGEIDFAQSSRPLEPQEQQQAQQQGVTLEEIPVALDGIAVAVNPALEIPGLTVDQILGIYTGQIRNWNNVGGPDLPIAPLSRTITEGGTVAILLQGKTIGADVKIVRNTTEGLRSLASNPGGVYLASAPEVVPQCTVKSIPVGNESNQFVPPYQGTPVPPSNCPAQRNQLNLPAFQSGEYPLTRQLFVVIRKDDPAKEQAGRAYANLLLTDQGQQLLTQAGFVRIR